VLAEAVFGLRRGGTIAVVVRRVWWVSGGGHRARDQTV